MEISPVAGIRAMPVVKVPPLDPKLTAVFDIDNSARIGDETWTPSDRESGRGAEDDSSADEWSDDEFEELDDLGEREAEAKATVAAAEKPEARQVSFFA
jgi:hypothetical protein